MVTIKISREAVPKIGRIFAERNEFRSITERLRSIKISCDVNRWKFKTIQLPSFFEIDFTEKEIEYLSTELAQPRYDRVNWALCFFEQI